MESVLLEIRSGGSVIAFDHAVTVRIDKKVVGIKYDGTHWRYWPKGSKASGEPFTTLQACQNSLR
jgi:hypothetical protein